MMSLSAESLRMELARRRVPVYVLAAKVGVHPGRLGMMLRESLPLNEALAKRVMGELRKLDGPQPSPPFLP